MHFRTFANFSFLKYFINFLTRFFRLFDNESRLTVAVFGGFSIWANFKDPRSALYSGVRDFISGGGFVFGRLNRNLLLIHMSTNMITRHAMIRLLTS